MKLRILYLNLCVLSESKIINSEETLKLEHSDLIGIEVLNFKESIKPTSLSKIYCKEKTIEIKRGKRFIFEDYFKPYLIDAKTIKVTDRYLRKTRAVSNLMRLLRLCKNLETIEINTILKDDSEKFKLEIKRDDFEKMFSKEFGFAKLILRTTGSHLRTLETENVKITLDPGFDFVDNDSIANNHDILITFKKFVKE